MIELADIVDAIFSSYDCMYYYDTVDDRILMYSDDYDPDDCASMIDDDSEDRFIFIEDVKYFNPGWECMSRFISTVDNEVIRDKLDGAIHRKGAFRNFRKVLTFHGLLERWYAFENEFQKERAIAWCKVYNPSLLDDRM